MDAVSAEHFMLDQFPLKLRPAIPATLKAAYAAVNILVSQEPILQVASAVDNRGRLIAWAVDLGVERLLKSGQWPFEYEWKDFAHPTGRYLSIRLSHAVLSVSQIAKPDKQPRNVTFRENGRLNNAPFFNLPEFHNESDVHGLPHFLLVHGHQELNFAHLAVPHSIHHRDYIYRTPNLMKLPHEIPDQAPAIEQTDFDAAMILKEEIEKWAKDNGE